MGIGNHLENLMRSRLLCLLSFLLLPSLAAAFSSSSSANQTTFGGFTATPSNVNRYTLSTASDGRVLVKSPVRIPLAGGGSFPVDVTGGISKPNAAAAVGRFLLKGSGVIGVLSLGVAAYDLARELGFTLDNSSGATQVTKPDPDYCSVLPCYFYADTYGGSPTRSQATACTSQATNFNIGTGRDYVYVGFTGSTTCIYNWTAGPGDIRDVRLNIQRTNAPVSTGPNGVPSTVPEVEQKIIDQMIWPTSSKLGEAVAEAIRLNDSLPVLSPVVTGPASVPGASSTTVDDATGETITTTQVVNNTYEGDKVTSTITTTTNVTNTSTGAPIRQAVTTTQPVAELPVSSETETAPFAMPCGIPGTPPCGVKVDESQTPTEVPADEFKPLLDEGKQAQEALLDQVKSDADKSFFEPFTDLFVTPSLAECVPLQIPGDRGTIDPCGTVGGARAIMAYIWALSGLALCLHMVRSAL